MRFRESTLAVKLPRDLRRAPLPRYFVFISLNLTIVRLFRLYEGVLTAVFIRANLGCSLKLGLRRFSLVFREVRFSWDDRFRSIFEPRREFYEKQMRE